MKKIKSLFKQKETYFHILFWIFYFSTINVSWTENWFDRSSRPESVSQFAVILFPIFFYINTFWFIPKYLKTRRWLLYVSITVAVICAIEAFRVFLYTTLHPLEDTIVKSLLVEFNSYDNIIFGRLNPIFLCLQFSFAYRFTRDWILNNSLIDQLKAEKLQMELSFLKAQINPHFLFNNLNALDDLIDSDPKRAKEYLHKLSNMYRYVITTSENDIVPLKQEWDFIDDYMYLLKERYGNAYKFLKNTEVSNLQNYIVPPTAIQSLIENAVKHNQGNIENPLVITISITQKSITVSHIKQLKNQSINTLGTGLKNIKTRFRLLSNSDVVIKDDDAFTVVLPLIQQL